MRLNRFPAAVATVLFMFAFFVSDVHAQKIYLLVAANTAENPENDIAPAGRANIGLLSNVFMQNVPGKQLVPYGVESYTGEDGESIDIDTPWLGPDVLDNSKNMEKKLLEAIRLCPAGPNDTIVFFYFGHGGYINEKHNLFMPNSNLPIPRERFSQALRTKNCRLAVLMTESCSSVPGDMIAELAEPCALPPTAISPLFDSLFIKARGLADFNSSTKPEFGMAPPHGGLMVLAMASIGKPYREGNRIGLNFDEPGYGILWQHKKRLSWSEFKSQLIEKENEIFKIFFPEGISHKEGAWVQITQTPHFFCLPNGKGCRHHHCFLKKLLQRLHCKKIRRGRVGCCR